MFGSITDINIWNVSLTGREMKVWTNLQMKAEGNIVSWSKASWVSLGLEEVMIDMMEICKHDPQPVFLGSNHEFHFNRTFRICKNIF